MVMIRGAALRFTNHFEFLSTWGFLVLLYSEQNWKFKVRNVDKNILSYPKLHSLIVEDYNNLHVIEKMTISINIVLSRAQKKFS